MNWTYDDHDRDHRTTSTSATQPGVAPSPAPLDTNPSREVRPAPDSRAAGAASACWFHARRATADPRAGAWVNPSPKRRRKSHRGARRDPGTEQGGVGVPGSETIGTAYRPPYAPSPAKVDRADDPVVLVVQRSRRPLAACHGRDRRRPAAAPRVGAELRDRASERRSTGPGSFPGFEPRAGAALAARLGTRGIQRGPRSRSTTLIAGQEQAEVRRRVRAGAVSDVDAPIEFSTPIPRLRRRDPRSCRHNVARPPGRPRRFAGGWRRGGDAPDGSCRGTASSSRRSPTDLYPDLDWGGGGARADRNRRRARLHRQHAEAATQSLWSAVASSASSAPAKSWAPCFRRTRTCSSTR